MVKVLAVIGGIVVLNILIMMIVVAVMSVKSKNKKPLSTSDFIKLAGEHGWYAIPTEDGDLPPEYKGYKALVNESWLYFLEDDEHVVKNLFLSIVNMDPNTNETGKMTKSATFTHYEHHSSSTDVWYFAISRVRNTILYTKTQATNKEITKAFFKEVKY